MTFTPSAIVRGNTAIASVLAVGLAACLVAGCAVGPDYVTPEVHLPARYLADPPSPRAQANARDDLIDWWARFDDPVLTRFVNLALAQNLDLEQAGARVGRARGALRAAGAALLPVADLQAETARAFRSVETPLGRVLDSTPGFDRYGTAYEVNAGARWELDVFGGQRREREAALADYQASHAAAGAARLAVAAQTADSYLQLRGLQSRLAIARKQTATQQALLDTVRRLYDKGLAAELQWRQVEGALFQVHASIPVLEAAADASMNALDVMAGMPPGTYRSELEVARPLPEVPTLAGSGAPGDLLRRRPDLIVAERRAAASSARIGAAVAEYYPKVSLSALLGSATVVSGSNLFASGASQWSGALGLRWRLFDFGRIAAQIEAAQGNDAEMLAAYRLAALRATEEVENAFSGIVRRNEQTRLLAQGEVSLGMARDKAFAAYQAGVVSLIDVLQADDSLLRAADALASARTESARASIGAFKALGGGWSQAPGDKDAGG